MNKMLQKLDDKNCSYKQDTFMDISSQTTLNYVDRLTKLRTGHRCPSTYAGARMILRTNCLNSRY